MMSFAVMASKADFNSAGTELLAAPEFVFTLLGAVVHATAKLSTAANETTARIRFFIRVRSSILLLDLMGCSMPKRGHKSNQMSGEFSDWTLGAKRLLPLLSLPLLIGTLQNFRQNVIHGITESTVEQYEIPPLALQLTTG
jgi:hypothetical protein